MGSKLMSDNWTVAAGVRQLSANGHISCHNGKEMEKKMKVAATFSPAFAHRFPQIGLIKDEFYRKMEIFFLFIS